MNRPLRINANARYAGLATLSLNSSDGSAYGRLTTRPQQYLCCTDAWGGNQIRCKSPPLDSENHRNWNIFGSMWTKHIDCKKRKCTKMRRLTSACDIPAAQRPFPGVSIIRESIISWTLLDQAPVEGRSRLRWRLSLLIHFSSRFGGFCFLRSSTAFLLTIASATHKMWAHLLRIIDDGICWCFVRIAISVLVLFPTLARHFCVLNFPKLRVNGSDCLSDKLRPLISAQTERKITSVAGLNFCLWLSRMCPRSTL